MKVFGVKISKIYLFIFVLVFLSACYKNQGKVNLSANQQLQIKINRFDSAYILLDTNNLHSDMLNICSRYPDFYNIFFSEILNLDPVDSDGIFNETKMYITDTTMMKVNKEVMKNYGNINDIEMEISNAFSIFHFYFHEKKLPKVFFFVSGFNRSIYYNENIIAIGTDMYLGQNYPLYDGITYNYLRYGMQKKFVSVDILTALISQQFGYDTNKERLIDNIIYRGKQLYLLSALLPERNIEDILCYTPEQIGWCEKYEKEIWGLIIDQKDLFSSDTQLIGKYLSPAPFTSPVSPESPGRLGLWVGLRIVQSYMNNNKNIGVVDLMKINDYQKILQDSGYRP
jgi:hypothetical protein